MARHHQVLHEKIGAAVTPFNSALQTGGAIGQYWDLGTQQGLAFIVQVVTQHATIIVFPVYL